MQSSPKPFAVTEAGAAHLIDRQAAVIEARDRLSSLAKKAERVDGAPIRRAMHNLAMAVRAGLEMEGGDAQTMFDAAALINEAAGKIERL